MYDGTTNVQKDNCIRLPVDNKKPINVLKPPANEKYKTIGRIYLKPSDLR